MITNKLLSIKNKAIGKSQKGFTLIELVIVLIILGILAAIVVPRYVDLTTDAVDAAKAGVSGSVKSAYAIYIAENKTQPTIAQLAAYVPNTTAVATGVQVDINGTNYVVPSYTDGACTTATTATTDVIACLGDIP